jgi:2-polyprenyl-6-methoxyphenol hydroxylase-like FAD-dependent oxidoreductase
VRQTNQAKAAFYFVSPPLDFDHRISQVHMDRWSAGRVALVGDAVSGPSPLSGVGTSLALVGAYVLAGELAAADGEHNAAFAGVRAGAARLRRPGPGAGQGHAIGLIPRSRSQIWLRNQAVRALPYMPWRGLLAGGVQKAADAIALKEY